MQAVHASLQIAMVELDGEQHPPAEMTLDLNWSVADPCAVRTTFKHGTHSSRWVFARELLYHGCFAAAGLGDVRTWPGALPDTVYLELDNREHRAVFRLPRQLVINFLLKTTDVVRIGFEDLNIDRLIDIILKEAAS